MLIREFQDPSAPDAQKLAALSQFLLSRAKDTAGTKKISVEAFLKLAGNQGISLTKDSLIELSTKPPLNGLIQDIQNDEVVFKGDESVTDTMTVDQARQTVDTMAKRAAKKGI